MRIPIVTFLAAFGCTSNEPAPTPIVDPAAAARGHEVAMHGTALNDDGTDTAFNMPENFFDVVWQVWDGPDGVRAQTATPDERRAMAYKRYGFVDAPFDNDGLPVGLLKKPGRIAQTCLMCHSSAVNGVPVFGLGNAHLDYQTFLEDMVLVDLLDAGQPLTRPVQGLPTISTVAGTNDGLGVALLFLSLRNPDLSQRDLTTQAPMDLGPVTYIASKTPAWWNLKHKFDHVDANGAPVRGYYYIDGFAPASERAFLNAELSTKQSMEYMMSRDADFADMEQYLYTTDAPKFPGTIDQALAARGKSLFESVCSMCHGTYGEGGRYEQQIVDLSLVRTDDLHLVGYAKQARDLYSNSWFGFMGEKPGAPAKGYIPPSLEGVWATAPYFHNGSVPTLEGVLFPDRRPAVWKATPVGPASYDLKAVGVTLEANVTAVPSGLTSAELRKYYDTSVRGMSNGGHPFGDSFTNDDERWAVIEYLKTL